MPSLDQSVERVLQLLGADLASDAAVEELLGETHRRRRMDLSDLDPTAQAELVASRSVGILPSTDALRAGVETAAAAGRPLVVKLGIDPTATDLHLGHAVPIIVLSRLQRMGHHVVFIIGDVTASIGDPSGRSSERPELTGEGIAANLATYRDQVAPFFDFEAAEIRHNSEWLADVRLPEMLGILGRVPVSASLQREDFRTRLAEGHGLSMSEFIYSVVMAIDSAKIHADIELGGVDQLLNMQMGRQVMEITGQRPQLVVSLPLIEGTDGSGHKMSKSLGNTIPLNGSPSDVFGRVMSVPDRLSIPYLRAWSEWTDPEVDAVAVRVGDASLHPMDLKRIVAGEATAALHGTDAAMLARRAFAAQFSRRSLSEVRSLPTLELAGHADATVGAVLTNVLTFTPSLSAARRLARQGGLRLIVEGPGGSPVREIRLAEEDVTRPLGQVVATHAGGAPPSTEQPTTFLRAGRRSARLLS